MRKKQLLKLLLLSLFGVLFGCQPDDTINAGSNATNKITSRTLSYDELKAMPDMKVYCLNLTLRIVRNHLLRN
ncbi:MAG: hypothetical protein ACLGH8_07135 [Bacteroidia bacterium]